MKKYETLTVDIKDQVATITFIKPPAGSTANSHWEVGAIFGDLRDDNSVRVIVVQGSGGSFKIPGPKSEYHSPAWHKDRSDPSWQWNTFTGVLRCHHGMAEIEKPIIAKVNGDAIGFGQSIVFACDFIVALEDAVLMDHHMGATFMGIYDGEKKLGGHDFSNVPGDGGAALIPLYMSPCKAKEYLMLSQPYTGAELAKLGIINYAVPAAELDAKVDELAGKLLKRGAYALARTKRLVNRRVVDQLNLTLDAGVAYEMVTQLQPLDITKLG